MSIFDFTVKDVNQQEVSLKNLPAKAYIIVNTASKCGLVGQLGDLEKLYETYHKDGLEILAFPSNQFMNQEPLEGEALQEFCQLNYNVKFPVFDKIDVNGKTAHPLYQYLVSHTGNKRIKWNYTKFLIDSEGKIVERFGSTKKPAEIIPAIEKVLAG